MHHGSFRTRHSLCRFTYGRIRHCIPSPFLDGAVCDAVHPRLLPTSGRTLPSRPFRRRQIITLKKHKVLANIPLMSRPRPATSVRLLVKSQAVRQHLYDPPLGRLFFYGLSTLLSIKTLSYLNGLQDHLAVAFTRDSKMFPVRFKTSSRTCNRTCCCLLNTVDTTIEESFGSNEKDDDDEGDDG